jgi:hypothetical protein
MFLREGPIINIHNTQIFTQWFRPYRVILQGEIVSLICHKIWGGYWMNERGIHLSNRLGIWVTRSWPESEYERRRFAMVVL